MRKAALQMMDYLQESVAKLSAANLEEAERNGYAWDAHFVPRAALRLPLAARQAHRGKAHREVKHTDRGLDSHESRCHTSRPAHTRSTTRPRASRACTQEELTELRTAQAGRDGQEGADGHRPRLEGEGAGHI